MGNHRFRLSDMIPNAWFYKLKDMGKSTRNHNNSHHPIRKKHLTSSTPIAAQPTQPKQPYISQSRHSYYFTTQERIHNSPINPKFSHAHFPDPPRKSSKRKCRRRTIKSSSSSSKVVTTSASVSAGCSCRATLDSVWTKSDSTPEDDTTSPDSDLQGSLIPEFGSDPVSITDKFEGLAASWSSSCSCQVSSSTTDIIIDMDANNSNSSCRKFDKLDGFDLIPEIELPPILTKPAPKFSDMVSEIKKKETEQPIQLRRRTAKLEERNAHGGSLSVKVVKEGSIKEEKTSSPHVKRSSPVSPGLKLRANSPRIASKKIQAYSRKSVSSTMTSRSRRKNISDSFAVVKSSFDPQRDFRDSMVEMIVENNIRASKDLEELLACYLSLNSNEYHDLIVKVFEKIWFDLTDLQL